MDINLINYKFFSESYIEYETNRKGKEYKYGELKYEGEYLNEEKNGKGKEDYNNGELKFEGEYLNGEKMEKEKNINMVNEYLKVNIFTEKDGMLKVLKEIITLFIYLKMKKVLLRNIIIMVN